MKSVPLSLRAVIGLLLGLVSGSQSVHSAVGEMNLDPDWVMHVEVMRTQWDFNGSGGGHIYYSSDFYTLYFGDSLYLSDYIYTSGEGFQEEGDTYDVVGIQYEYVGSEGDPGGGPGGGGYFQIDTNFDGQDDYSFLAPFMWGIDNAEDFEYRNYYHFLHNNGISRAHAPIPWRYFMERKGGYVMNLISPLGPIHTENTWPYNQTSNVGCAVGAARNTYRHFKGGSSPSERDFSGRMAGAMGKHSSHFEHKSGTPTSSDGVPPSQVVTAFNAALEPYGIVVRAATEGSTPIKGLREFRARLKAAAQENQILLNSAS